MIEKTGSWNYNTLITELKSIDPSCGISTSFENIEGVHEGKITIFRYDPDREELLRGQLNKHDAGASLAAEIARKQRIAESGPAIKEIQGWATWTAQEAVDYIDASVNDLLSAKIAMKNMAKILCYLRDRAGIL